MRGYYKNDEATTAAFTPDGWLRTGDLGHRDADGFFFVTGRIKELIIKGGENIAPREIDEVLLRHPAVLDAAAVGMPDKHYGQEILACVVLREGVACSEDELRAFCQQHLGRYKTPKVFRFVTELPRGGRRARCTAEAEQVLREGLQRQPGIGELQYSLGLLLAEQQRLSEAADALDKAAKLLPQRARAHYNLGLARQQLGQPKPAEAALRRARELDPGDPAFGYALAVFYAQQGRRADALREAEALQTLLPGDPRAQQLLQRLRAGP